MIVALGDDDHFSSHHHDCKRCSAACSAALRHVARPVSYLATELTIGNETTTTSTRSRSNAASTSAAALGVTPRASTTVFPVFIEQPPPPQRRGSRGGHALCSSQIRVVDEHDAKSRTHSTDTLACGRRSNGGDAAAWARDDVVRAFALTRAQQICRFVHDFTAIFPTPFK